nr:hypothetical protein [Micromonospora sp. DSM 115978]
QGDVERAVAWVSEALDLSAERPSALLTARSSGFLAEARRSVGMHVLLDDVEERLRSWSVPLA